MTMFQLFELLIVVTVYVVIVVLQITVGERRLRSLAPRESIFSRIGLSIVHGFIGCLAFAMSGAYVNIQISGDYRYGPLGYYGFLFPICGGIIGLFIPWLGLLRKKHGQGE
jgi:hypothetical protein